MKSVSEVVGVSSFVDYLCRIIFCTSIDLYHCIL